FQYWSSAAADGDRTAGKDISLAIHAELGHVGALAEEDVAGIVGGSVVEYAGGYSLGRARSDRRNTRAAEALGEHAGAISVGGPVHADASTEASNADCPRGAYAVAKIRLAV